MRMLVFHLSLVVVLLGGLRSNSLSPHMEMKHSPINARSSLQIPSQPCAMPSSQTSTSSYSRMSSGPSPVPIIDETTSDPLSNNMMRSPFVPKVEDTCSNSGMYGMDSIMNDGTTMMSSRSPIIDEATTMMGEGTSVMNETDFRNKFSSSGSEFKLSIKGSPSEFSWMPNPEMYGNEPNIENWLGQIFKTDNLIAGCSLPQQQ